MPSFQSNIWNLAEHKVLEKMFDLGRVAIYESLGGEQTPCHIFVDHGWRDELSRYDSHAGEQIITISVLLSEIPAPKQHARIIIDDKKYQIVSSLAQDQYIALLHVIEST